MVWVPFTTNTYCVYSYKSFALKTSTAAWLSWLKRLSSKQEIPCSNHGAASFLIHFKVCLFNSDNNLLQNIKAGYFQSYSKSKQFKVQWNDWAELLNYLDSRTVTSIKTRQKLCFKGGYSKGVVVFQRFKGPSGQWIKLHCRFVCLFVCCFSGPICGGKIEHSRPQSHYS